MDFTFRKKVSQKTFNPVEMRGTLCAIKVPLKTMEKDAEHMIQLFLKRGANIDAILSRSPDGKKKKIEYLKSTYGLKANVGKGGHVITLSRIAACFPLTTITSLYKIPENKLNRPIELSKMRKYCSGYPKVFMTTIVCSVLPLTMSEVIKQKIFNAICLYSVLEQKKINQKFTNENYKAISVCCLKYIELYYNYKILNDKERVSFCASDVMNEVFEVKEGILSIKNVINVADKAFQELLKSTPDK